jgi:transposase InsO family protein
MVFEHAGEYALYDRPDTDRLINHSDQGVQHLLIRYTERLIEAGNEPLVGSRGDSYYNALTESVIGFYKTESCGRENVLGTEAAISRITNHAST